jgi:hypothetical protein
VVHHRPVRYVDLGPLLIVVAAAFVVAVGVAMRAARREDPVRGLLLAGRVLLVGAVLAVLDLTLTGGTPGDRSFNLVPGAGIRSSLANVNHELGILNLVGNALLFAPVAFLLVVVNGWGIVRAVAAAAGLSVLVEVTQYAVGRAADIDDVLLNTAGALIGALVARIVVAAVSVLRRGRAEAGAANRIG